MNFRYAIEETAGRAFIENGLFPPADYFAKRRGHAGSHHHHPGQRHRLVREQRGAAAAAAARQSN
jgi:hypothetical protein